MRELIIYNATRDIRTQLSNWLNYYATSSQYTTNVMDFSKPRFFLRFETDTLIPLFKKHWTGLLLFYDLNTYNGKNVQINVKDRKLSQEQRAKIAEELVQWFKDNIPEDDYSITENAIQYIKNEEDINLFRLVCGDKVDIKVQDYIND